jgi:hypothetical protein
MFTNLTFLAKKNTKMMMPTMLVFYSAPRCSVNICICHLVLTHRKEFRKFKALVLAFLEQGDENRSRPYPDSSEIIMGGNKGGKSLYM